MLYFFSSFLHCSLKQLFPQAIYCLHIVFLYGLKHLFYFFTNVRDRRLYVMLYMEHLAGYEGFFNLHFSVGNHFEV